MEIPELIPAEGIEIPLSAAFSGIKNVSLLSFANNSINPKLLLFEDATETRVLSSRRPFSEIDYKIVLAGIGFPSSGFLPNIKNR